MPKRRITTAKQRAASRRNLIKARARRRENGPIPTGKSTLLVHSTKPATVDKILGGKKLKPHSGSEVFFSRAVQHKSFSDAYGKGKVSVKVSRKVVQTNSRSVYGTQPDELKVHVKNLRGVKIKRYK